MKKSTCIAILTAFTIFFILLCGCSNFKPTKNKNTNLQTDTTSKDKPATENENNSDYSIKDYYPFTPNAKYIYEGDSVEYTSYTSWVDYIKDNRIQLRTNNGGTETVKVLENIDGELKVIFHNDGYCYRENFTSKPTDKNEILLKEPIKKGTSWILPDGRKRYISNVNIKVNTPLGSYNAIEVTTEEKGAKTLDYYALNMGLIKTVFSSSDMKVKVSSVLSKIENNSPLTQSVKFYYPNINDGKIYFIRKDLSFNTNDITKLSFEKNFKESPKNSLGKLLGPNVKIKSLYLNNDNMLYVDFSKEFITEMNAGAGYEMMILQSITNTLGNYYEVNKVYITVENKPYSSGHIIMNKGEAFTVDSENCVEIK